jgi:hypothetical protein
MRERRRRLVPLILEKVEMPTWMYNIMDINFTDPDPLVLPLDKLKKTLENPQWVILESWARCAQLSKIKPNAATFQLNLPAKTPHVR